MTGLRTPDNSARAPPNRIHCVVFVKYIDIYIYIYIYMWRALVCLNDENVDEMRPWALGGNMGIWGPMGPHGLHMEPNMGPI